MIALVIQTVLLFAIAFILGCIVGCLLRRFFGHAEESANDEQPAAAVAAAPGGAVEKASVQPAIPRVPAPPIPVTPSMPEETAKVETPPAPFVAKPTGEDAPVAPVENAEKTTVVATKQSSADDHKATPKNPPARKPMPAASKPDNLKLIRGIGAQNQNRLNGLGINSFAQIASWTKNDERHFGEVLAFPGRIEREEWVSQAKVLAKGGTTDFSKRVRQGTVKTSTGSLKPTDLGQKPAGLLAEARDGKEDNLTLIDGIGNALERKLFNIGIFHFDQIAAMSADELKWLGYTLGFPGRPERENWAGESKILAAGGTTDHAKRVERGQIKTSRKSSD